MGLDVSNLEGRLKHHRGPLPGIGAGRGPGRPWAGIVEETRAVWVTWLTDYARQTGKPIPRGLSFSQGSYVPIVGVQLTFGVRYFFQCPECGRRCEAVYILGRRVACRKCLRLGYRSQASRAGSAWGFIERLMDRHAFDPPARWCPSEDLHVLAFDLGEHIKRRLEDVLSTIGGVDYGGSERSGEGGPAGGPAEGAGGGAGAPGGQGAGG